MDGWSPNTDHLGVGYEYVRSMHAGSRSKAASGLPASVSLTSCVWAFMGFHALQVTKWRLQQEQYHHQASTQQRADTLRAVRTATPATRRKKEQQVAAFAKQCNKLR